MPITRTSWHYGIGVVSQGFEPQLRRCVSYWVFSMGRYPHSCRSQILALIVSVYSTVCIFETRRVPCVWSNLRQGK